MALGCREAARISLATLGGHADEAERLELEEHLTGCSRCDQDHAVLGLVRHLRDVPPSMTAAERQGIRQALLARRVRVAPPPRRLVWPFAAAAAGVVAVAALALFAWPQRSYRLVGGDVTVASLDVAGGSAARAWTFGSTNGGTIRVGQATADLAKRTAVAWSPSERTMTLSHGSITVDVEHQVGRHFLVRTPRFIVEVVGTRFTVDLTGVRTQRGLVRVLRLDGKLVARVEAGQSWSDDPPAGATASAASAAAEARVTTIAAAVSERRSVTPAAAPKVVGDGSSAPRLADGRGLASATSAVVSSPGDRLAEARHSLSRGDVVTARRLAATLFRQKRDLAVEARVLFAESFLVEGRYADAVDAYRVVARDFPRSDQAETSLFTVAQLEGEHGRASDARMALRAYIGRYPHGRFAREAGDRLGRLSSAD